MLYYDRIDVSEGMLIKQEDVSKAGVSKECDVSDFWYLNYSFKFQPNVCNRYHDLLMISLISKNEVINLMQNADLTEKSGTL